MPSPREQGTRSLRSGRETAGSPPAIEARELLLRHVAGELAPRLASSAASARSEQVPQRPGPDRLRAPHSSAASGFFRGSTVPTQSAKPAAADGPGEKTGSTPYGMTTTFDSGRPYSPTRSRRVRSEQVSTLGGPLDGSPHDGSKESASCRAMRWGASSNERSWTVTIAGQGQAEGNGVERVNEARAYLPEQAR